MAGVEDDVIKFQSPSTKSTEQKGSRVLSFESLQPEDNVETPDVVRAIVELQKQEQQTLQQAQSPETGKEPETSSDTTSTSHEQTKPSNQRSSTTPIRVNSTSRSNSKVSARSASGKQQSRTSVSPRTTPISVGRKTPDKKPLLPKPSLPKTAYTPRNRTVTMTKTQLSPVKSSRGSTGIRSRSSAAPSPSVSIDLSVREATKDFEGLTCTPCENQDTYHEAFYWCRDCNEALCEACADHHKSLRMSKGHKLIRISENDEMPFTLQIKEHCAFHKHKRYEFYCSEHDATICAQCVTSTHKFCQDVQTIDEAAQKSLSFTDMKLISEKLKTWSNMVEKLQTQRARNLRELEVQRSTIEKEIRKFRNDLVKHFDAMEQRSLDELAEVYAKNLKEIKRQNEALTDRLKSIGGMQRDIKMMQNYSSQYQVFLGTRELREKQDQEVKQLKMFEGQFNLVSLEFVVTNFMDLPLKVEKFGIVRSNIKTMPLSSDIKFEQNENDKIKQPDPAVVTTMPSRIVLKSKRCFSIEKGGNFNFIRGGTILPDNRVILLDHNNKCLIVLNPKGSMLDKITFYSCPWDVCTLDPDKVALTIPDKKEIVIMETNKFTLVQQIKVSNSCSGIAAMDGRIVVVSDKTGFLILDRMGTIAATIKCDVSGVRYVVAAFGNIYYTDFIRKTVNCIDISGNRVFRFQNDNLKYPCDITAIRDEFVLVTGYNSKNLIAVAADGKYHEVILTHRDGLMYPTAVDYCHETATLMLCTNRRGTIEVFEMT